MNKKDFLIEGIDKIGRPYKGWTKEGVRKWIGYVLHHPEAMREVHIHLVDQNIKLSALMFSTTPGPKTEENLGLGTCEGLPCHDICYAIRADNFRPSAMLANMENLLLLKFDFPRAVAEFRQKLANYKRRCEKDGKPCMVRWHQAGEFTPEDSALLDRMSELFPDVTFYGYTKRPEYYVKYYHRKNVNILWSAWRGMEIPKEVLECGKLKAFFVEFKDGNNEYIFEHLTDADRKRIRRCPGLIKGEFACNKCKFACSKNMLVLAHEH